MIFDGKTVHEISEAEISQLVAEHVCERQYLEFKLTYVLKDDDSRIELLKDICSFANSGGGYLIIGIRDDGKGKAMRFELDSQTNLEQLKNQIHHLTIQHIEERIIPEYRITSVADNQILLIRIPESGLAPHMVKYQNKTIFVSRYSDGKREMTLGEIRNSFMADITAHRLDNIEGEVKSLSKQIRADNIATLTKELTSAPMQDLLFTEDAVVLSNSALAKFETTVEGAPYLYLSSTPSSPGVGYFDCESNGLFELVRNPPKSRHAGWDMNMNPAEIKKGPLGLKIGYLEYRLLEVWQNGHVQFSAKIDTRFCWHQTEAEFEKQPLFYPLVVTEFIVSFLRFQSDLMKYKDSEGYRLFRLKLCNIKGFGMRPARYELPSEIMYTENDFYWKANLQKNFNPDELGFSILSNFFNTFGYKANQIPYWQPEKKCFEFPNN